MYTFEDLFVRSPSSSEFPTFQPPTHPVLKTYSPQKLIWKIIVYLCHVRVYMTQKISYFAISKNPTDISAKRIFFAKYFYLISKWPQGNFAMKVKIIYWQFDLTVCFFSHRLIVWFLSPSMRARGIVRLSSVFLYYITVSPHGGMYGDTEF